MSRPDKRPDPSAGSNAGQQQPTPAPDKPAAESANILPDGDISPSGVKPSTAPSGIGSTPHK